MALGRCCEFLGVEDPGELPARRCDKFSEAKEAIIYSARVVINEVYKEDVKLGEGFDNPLIVFRELSHNDLIACTTYTQRLRDSERSHCSPSTGPPPPGYDDV